MSASSTDRDRGGPSPGRDRQGGHPGFIDTHAHGDPLVSGPQGEFRAPGVTTKVVGQDGRTPGFHMDIRTGYRLSMDNWRESMASPDPASERPRSLLEWSLKVERKGVAPNIAALVGIGSLRWMTGVGTRPVPTPEQLAMMIEILEAEMQAGAYGISSGLEYVPERYSHTDELVAMAKVVGARDGVVMSHMRTEDAGDILGAIDELVAQGRYARVNASHIKIVGGLTRHEGEEVVDRIRTAAPKASTLRQTCIRMWPEWRTWRWCIRHGPSSAANSRPPPKTTGPGSNRRCSIA